MIDHSGDDVASMADSGPETATSFGDTGSGDGPNLGNFPEPAVGECGNLPPGVDPIPGLSSAWAVAGNAPGTDIDGMLYPDDRVRLRFSDHGGGCDEAFGAIIETCVDTWAFAFSVSAQGLAPGVYDLGALAGLYPEMYASMGSGAECAGEIGGGGGLPGAEIQGELELFSVTGGCVVGELRGLSDVFGDLDVDRNGGFVAMRCESECVPMVGNDCGE